eukprot:365844-Chlamydomonas_euryale.AAC.7
MLQWRVGVRRLVRVNNDGAGRAAIARFVNVPLPFCTCLGVIELGHLEVAMLVLVHWLQRLVHCLRAVDELWVGFEDLERRAPAAAVPLCDGRQARQQELGRQQLGHRLEQALRRARFRQHRFDLQRAQGKAEKVGVSGQNRSQAADPQVCNVRGTTIALCYVRLSHRYSLLGPQIALHPPQQPPCRSHPRSAAAALDGVQTQTTG